MTIEESKLKLALVSLLPDSVIKLYVNPQFPSLATVRWMKDGRELQGTELLHLCFLIEAILTPAERDDYYYSGLHQKDEDHSWTVSAPWQLRAEKLANIRKVEL